MGEMPYERIAVKDILGRATVGRSTFYTHFDNKDALLHGCIHDILRAQATRPEPTPARPHEHLLWFSLPILEHVEQHRRDGYDTAAFPGRDAMHARLRVAIGELIEHEVEAAVRGREGDVPPPGLVVEWIASTFVLVLDWWVERKGHVPARQADRLFRWLVEPRLATRWSGHDATSPGTVTCLDDPAPSGV